MRFLAHLRPELIRIVPPWRTFGETAAGLVAALAEAGVLPARARVEYGTMAVAPRPLRR